MTDNKDATRWGVVAALVLTGVLAAAQMFKYSPALPLIRSELDIGLVGGGWLFSLTNVLGATVGVAAGLVADRFGQRRMLMAGLVIFTVAALTGARAPDPAWLYISRILESCGFLCVVIPAASLIARECAVRDRALALTVWGCYNPAGGAMMLIAAPYLMAPLGWRGLWLLMAAATAAVLALLVVVRPRRRPAGAPPPAAILQNLKHAAAVPGPWLIGASFGFYTLQYIVVMSWLPSVLVETRHLPLETAGLLTALVVAANIGGNLLAGWFLKRGARHGTLIMATALLMAASAAAIFSGLPDLLRYLGCVSLSLWGGLLPGSVMAAVPVLAPSPQQLGAVNGFVVQGSNIGLLLGPPLAAALVAATGDWNSLLLLFLAANAAVMVTGARLARLEARVRESASS